MLSLWRVVAFLTFSCFSVFFVAALLVRKCAFSSTTCTLYGSQFLDKSQVGEVNTMLEETYIYSTLWNLNCDRWYLSPRLGLRLSSRKSLILLLLLIAGDIETRPGPTSDVFPDIKQFIRNRGLKIFHQNARGLHDFGKIEQLKLLMEETNKEIQILGVTETHLNNNISDEELLISGYRVERKDRENGPCGGTAVYIRDDIQWQRRNDLEVNGIECLWIELLIKRSKSILLGIIYRPPDTSKYLDKDFEAKCEDMLNMVLSEDKEVIMTGDLNCNYKKKADNKTLKEIIKMNSFEQVIKESTRVTQDTSTLIDVHNDPPLYKILVNLI